MKRVRIQLELSPRDQKVLNYQTCVLEWDFENLMGRPLAQNENKDEVIQAIRKDISLPAGYLEDYQVVLSGNVLLVIP